MLIPEINSFATTAVAVFFINNTRDGEPPMLAVRSGDINDGPAKSASGRYWATASSSSRLAKQSSPLWPYKSHRSVTSCVTSWPYQRRPEETQTSFLLLSQAKPAAQTCRRQTKPSISSIFTR